MGNEKAILVALAAAAVVKKTVKAQRGEPGESIVGPRGERGESGKDGIDGVPGRDGNDGFGIPGRDGVDGVNGKDGVGVSDVLDLGGGLFRILLSDGSVKEFAAPVGKTGASGSKGEKGAQGDPGKDGQRGDKGDQGEKGEQGDIGPMPRHEWDGTKLRFEMQPGQWGQFVDLKGQRGASGRGGYVVDQGQSAGSSSASATIRLTAASSVLSYRIVTTNSAGMGIYADSGQAQHVDQVIGISVQAAGAGQDFEVQQSGFVENSGWNWVPGQALFLGLNGEVVASPVGVFSLQIGYAKSATEIYLRIARGVLRA